jgi:hypothetical protein
MQISLRTGNLTGDSPAPLCDNLLHYCDITVFYAVSRTEALVCTSGTNSLVKALSASAEPERILIRHINGTAQDMRCYLFDYSMDFNTPVLLPSMPSTKRSTGI